MENININASALEKELEWFYKVLKARMDAYFSNGEPVSFRTLPPPDLSGDQSVYTGFVSHYKFSPAERITIMLAAAPHLRPQLLDLFYAKNTDYDRGFTEFGGIKGANHGGFIPTGETASFVLGGLSLVTRIQLSELLGASHPFSQHNILKLNPPPEGEPWLAGTLELSDEYLQLFTIGKYKKPTFSSKFPARLITTTLNWDQLVLDANTREEIDEIISWAENQQMIMHDWGLAGNVKPGYRALFFGPPGTGKTLTASLIGKQCAKDVYKIDASMVVSKWVGETEKNLSRVFDMAENKDWILFFDEADALFGKRSDTSSSQERYANQEVSYLLQRTEDYPGIVILASNLKGNIDEAFTRRFQSMVHFPMPNPREREELWKTIFGRGLELHEDIDFKSLARQHEISGGSIVNILKYCAIKASQRKNRKITLADVQAGIRKEMAKEGKTG
ncbi:MAG: ATPase AAA [Bacteroidetes bacterium]|nr:MAG: ATPase AAA [Bacteroidota bacterium]